MKNQKLKIVRNLLKISLSVIILISISCNFFHKTKIPPILMKFEPAEDAANTDYFDTLKWTFTNNDYDEYTVDLYLDTVSDPSLAKENIQDDFYKFECLPNKTYFWEFILKDTKGDIISKDKGSFKTANYPMNPTPANGATIHKNDTLKWDCAEFSCGNLYSIDLYRGNEHIELYSYGENKYYIINSLTTGTYTWKVTVDSDCPTGERASNTWSFNFSNGK